MARWDEPNHREMLERAARLVARLCLANDIPIRFIGPIRLRLGWRGICEHSDISAAWRQTSHWDLGNFPRRRFADLCRKEAARIKKEARQ
jgi:hypothetical protein